MNDKTHWLDEPRNVKLLWRVFLGVLALDGRWPNCSCRCIRTSRSNRVFGFHAWFGFWPASLMIVVAKGLALLLKRPDTYYGPRAAS